MEPRRICAVGCPTAQSSPGLSRATLRRTPGPGVLSPSTSYHVRMKQIKISPGKLITNDFCFNNLHQHNLYNSKIFISSKSVTQTSVCYCWLSPIELIAVEPYCYQHKIFIGVVINRNRQCKSDFKSLKYIYPNRFLPVGSSHSSGLVAPV